MYLLAPYQVYKVRVLASSVWVPEVRRWEPEVFIISEPENNAMAINSNHFRSLGIALLWFNPCLWLGVLFLRCRPYLPRVAALFFPPLLVPLSFLPQPFGWPCLSVPTLEHPVAAEHLLRLGDSDSCTLQVHPMSMTAPHCSLFAPQRSAA